MRIAFLTLGCKVNYYESEKMMEAFRKKGFSVVDFTDDADIYVVNTCTVTNIADRKSRQMLHRARKNNPQALIVAVGCYVDSAGEAVDADETIDIAFGNKDKPVITERIEAALENRLKSRDHMQTTEDVQETAGMSGESVPGSDTHKQRTRAFIKVQDGCNQFCSYCLIPYVRGRGELSSTPPEQVVKEVEERVANGCREVVLTGIHLSSYGITEKRADGFVRAGGEPLRDLIGRVNRVEGLKRIRLGSLEPRIITREWLEGLKDCDKLCPHFHLSLQSGSDATLQRMNRHYTTAEFTEKAELLREFYEKPAITTDVIVGFPGETEEEFAETVDFLDSIGFADLHIFQYSMRDGTRAAAMADQIPPEVKKERSELLLERTKRWRETYIREQEKAETGILFEEYESVGGERILTGFNERYVRYGIPEQTARERGLEPGMVVRLRREDIRQAE